MPSNFLEKTLEDIVFENKETIHLRGLSKFKQSAFRQVVLPSGKRIDILGFSLRDGHLSFDVYELKKDYINIEAVCQAYNYVEEIKSLIKGSFKSWDASIIMVGRRYDAMSILDAISIPVNVYIYDYKIDGIKFEKMAHSTAYYPKHEGFSLGVWAWGLNMVNYPNGMPNSVSFHNNIQSLLNEKEFENKLKGAMHSAINGCDEAEQYTESVIGIKRRQPVITEIFPPQPAWSNYFATNIPYTDDLLEDFCIDDCDDEIEELENDNCDDEQNGDYEPDWETIRTRPVYESIHWEGFKLSELQLPLLYYSHLINSKLK